MEYQYSDHHLPVEITGVFRVLDRAGFFSDGLLIGSWAMLFYQEALGFRYVLRTGDIDFAIIQGVSKKPELVADLEAQLVEVGLEPVIDRTTGLQKFLLDLYEVEFLIPRTGGRDNIQLIKKYNVNAQPLPFLDILFIDPITVCLPDSTIRIPRPEALFFHKMIIAQRRKKETKKYKDLEQCQLLAEHIDHATLKTLAHGYKLGRSTIKMIRQSCAAIGFAEGTLLP